MNPRELRQQATAVLDEARELLDAAEGEDRDLTDEERNKYDDLVAQHKTKIARAERIEGMDARAVPTPVDDDPVRNPITSPNTERKLTLGEQAQACAYRAIVAKSGVGEARQFFGTDLCREIEHRATGASEGVGADGGFLVGTQESSELLTKTHEVGKLYPLCRKIEIGAGKNGLKIPYVNETSRADGSRWGGIRAYRTCEAATKTASQTEFAQWKRDLEKLVVYTVATDELLQDATALNSYLNDVVPKEFAFKNDDEILNGTGVGMILGVLASPALVTVAKGDGQAAKTITFENVNEIRSRFWADSRANMAWVINQDCEPELNTMAMAVGDGGVPVYMPAGGVSTAPYASLYGRPVIVAEQAQTLGTLGDIYALDLSQLLVIEKGGIESASSIHVHFSTDETAFRWVMRNNGAPMWAAPMTPFNSTNTLSPFVALATRA